MVQRKFIFKVQKKKVLFQDYRVSEYRARIIAQITQLQVTCSFSTCSGFAVCVITTLYASSSKVTL